MSPRDALRPNKQNKKVRKFCKGCEKEFYVWPNEAKRGRKYCSRKCMHTRELRECVLCGIQFTISRRSTRQICGKSCPSLRVTYNCIVCGVTVTRPRCFGMGQFCSDRCHKVWYKDNDISIPPLPRGMHKSIAVKSKRRHKIRNGDLIDRSDVFDFYGWICIVCGEDIDKSLEYPDKMSATLEHIVPLANGGTHTWDNVAPSHLLCNSKKGSDHMADVVARHKQIWDQQYAV